MYSTRVRFVGLMMMGWLVAAGASVRAEAVRNGNDFALAFTTAEPAERPGWVQKHNQLYHTFRYLKITGMCTERGKCELQTVEPSSDAIVTVVTSSKMSLELAATLSVGDCVAVQGRLVSVAMEGAVARLRLDPAVLQFKDKSNVKIGRELLNEVDKRAR